uniref:Uncharacterized protein n=1 Tax=Fagus sylvatica TaxID=28930 RepID=A0A2N9F8K9_FAGSY
MAKILVLSLEPCTVSASTKLGSGSLSLLSSLSLSAALFSLPLGFSLLYFFLSLSFEWSWILCEPMFGFRIGFWRWVVIFSRVGWVVVVARCFV